jgi:glycosyltransferase involved in cell wall biosynthesis
MTSRATILNLVPVSDTDSDMLCDVLGVDECVFIPGKEVRERGAREGLQYLINFHRQNGGEILCVHTLDWQRQTQRTGIYGLACMVPAAKRIVVDVDGNTSPLSLGGLLFSEIPMSVSQKIRGGKLRNRVEKLVDEKISDAVKISAIPAGRINSIGYLRTDLWFEVKAGGSIGHVAGVVDGFRKNGIGVNIVSWDVPPLIPEEVECITVPSDGFFRNDRELELISYNDTLITKGLPELREKSPGMIYARYALNCYAPVIFAGTLGVPLVLEYNGSEVWIEKHWGRGLAYTEISEKIESLLLYAAKLITVVSNPLKDELVTRGISADKILVNPNSVDPDRFNPDTYNADEIMRLRQSLNIPDKATVAGFIGTFSPWHGVEVLAEAIPSALDECQSLYFLLIGSGPLFDQVKSTVEKTADIKRVIFTGLIPQDEAPRYLMCSDFFLSPHVPNPDGTPFFGSPTKLFEYMALGKGIIASNLDQLGEVLEHHKTALLVKPGDAYALSSAIERMYKDRLFAQQLGDAARKEAISRHTWEAHAGKILAALNARDSLK